MDQISANPPAASAGRTLHGISFTLQLDRNVYRFAPDAPRIEATLTMRCERDAPLPLTFSGQQFDFAIDDASGRQIALWSTGRVFPDYVEETKISGERTWKATMPLPPVGRIGDPLADASFTMTGYLLPLGEGPVHSYSATVGFEVVNGPVLHADGGPGTRATAG